MLVLADLVGFTECEVKSHIAVSYSGEGEYDSTDRGDAGSVLAVLSEYSIIVAYESVGDYGCDSSSWFLLQDINTGEYFEFSGSHCSCFGFEGQFDLQPVDITYLKSDKFYLGCGGYDDDCTENQEAVKSFLQTL